MIVKKKDAMELLQQYQNLFVKLFDKPCTIKFDMHESHNFVISGIELQTLQGVKNKPDKVDYDGKKKSPMMFTILNNQSPLIFIFDDTIVSPLSNGVRLSVRLNKPINNKEVIEIDIRIEG